MEPRMELLPRMEVSSKLFHVRFYDKHQDRYSSSFQLFVDGDCGHIYGLNGVSFMRLVPIFIVELFSITKTNRIDFHMMEETLTVLKRALGDVVILKELYKFEQGGREFVFVEISRRIECAEQTSIPTI